MHNILQRLQESMSTNKTDYVRHLDENDHAMLAVFVSVFLCLSGPL